MAIAAFSTSDVSADDADTSGLVDVNFVADFCGCSPRHVHRMASDGRMPAPCKLGALVRWNKRAVFDWAANGCPRVDGHANTKHADAASEARPFGR